MVGLAGADKDVEFAVGLRTEDDGEELVMKLQDLPQAKVTKIVTDHSVMSSSKIRESLAGENQRFKP
jgi:hypothetical protein